MTRGQIHTYGSVSKNGYITITLDFKVSPSLKVIVYYVNALGETIADSKTFDVADCFQNQVCMALAPLHGECFQMAKTLSEVDHDDEDKINNQ